MTLDDFRAFLDAQITDTWLTLRQEDAPDVQKSAAEALIDLQAAQMVLQVFEATHDHWQGVSGS